ncbi:DUF5304 domain-containing protein [Streptomyces lunaelactis]|uniref:DUF5304 domain-containing protein n=1 Tax=Streptomyces lunaelactis TaxID=1535768 RepID=UPI00158462F0|nr:DUF5304 domain-containing protein [Streptomyces lunaelactis]NUK01951.1 DUF5304 domain-containing protein [Streptomyces lunaelactis]NUK14835.1 DUF5304 domain-containing protein [Streptomyces lunaelactis]NUK49504.1 DUF5304 domain-containing protein [Streptomyces lunaelactis]NUK63765.1 DUF5304 domain-containing protein [Streptomyces lunaelactis]
MSDATERPTVDADAWAKACAEDLEAEKARRRTQYGPEPGSAGEELRKLLDAVADKVSSFQTSLPGMAAQSAVSQLVNQAKSAVEPVIERNPQIFDHLAAAGSELLAAYRSAVEGHERRWTHGPTDSGNEPRDGFKDATDPRDEGPGASEHIDLD